ncbi:hypothetical protein GQ53DRAFT_45518 [Thozetella sp. PMI_491]|nr:hypothetical protein GQ53DRAFT_45518 [Thozetella sp. PMI_491]
MPSGSLPARAEVLHAYRHLLREASYLPLVARPFITDRVKHLFRRHRSTNNPEKYIRSAQHGHRYLRAATTGSLDRLRTILLHVFARTGRRRRALISQFVRLEPAADSDALEEQMRSAAVNFGAGKKARKADWLDKWDVEKLKALMKSQASRGMRNTPNAVIEPGQVNLERRIPKENIWGRPMSPAVTRTKQLKVWRDMIPKVLPPLPRGEWELLRDLASGKRPIQEWQLPRRRTPVATTAARKLQKDGGAWRWEAYASQPTSKVERGRSRRLKAMSGLHDDTSPNPSPPIGHHEYTPRTLIHLYRDIWAMTAIMDKKSDGRGWNITWGGTEPSISTATSLEFFEGAPVTAAAHEGRKRGKRANKQAAS